MAFLTLNKLKKQFGTFSALKGIELEIQKGEFIVFVGPSGCGKSTLLRLIAGLETPESGSIYLDGREVTALPAAKRNLAMVFQTYALYPHMNVFQNLSFALRLAKHPKAVIKAKVHKAAELLKLSPYLYRFPRQLSGGQRQRVAIGRAIVREPKAFLFDEPLSNLDAALRSQTRVEIANLHNNLKATTIYVTHDQVEAMTLADRVIVLREGTIEQVGTPLELFDTPANKFVAQFIGTPKMNLLPLAALSPKSQAPFLTFLKQKKAAKAVEAVGIRPEHLSLFSLAKKGKAAPSAAAKQKTLSAKVLLVEHLGDETLVYLTLEQGLRIVARSAERLFLTPNEPVAVQVDFNKTHFFDAEEKALSF